ncbi:helix-turn-helix domain-containing protein [Geomonas nitrogeniifigens]|uniref:helix-turn-helix domain-containing protein n=1 Tax=Geomonas diazotrophica TaxID=2843197 RepID=UPI001C2C2627|nr:helix-turn-helix transcriptional regulator [Geomonas nitrogeniifigens]QXE87307.1 helix-turn-helix domain-containing protein [Geomonas nitrogeniifigens]
MGYKPVSYNAGNTLANELKPPEFKEAWEASEDEFAALDILLSARKQAGLTQEEVANRMGISQPSLARVEGSLGSHRHSPSLEMLRKYAAAVDCKLEIRLVRNHS